MSDRYRILLGSAIIIGLLALAAAIALGDVQEKNSYGLAGVMAIIGKIALDFSEWAFRSRAREAEEKPPEPPEQQALVK